MSVNVWLIQIPPEQLATFQEQPAILLAFVEDMGESRATALDAEIDEPIEHTLYIEEFARSLLTDLKPIHSPFEPIHRAMMFPSHIFDGMGYEYGGFGFHTADEVKSLYESLNGFPQASLQTHLESKLASMREVYSEADFQHLKTYFQRIHLAGAEHLDVGEVVRQYQQVCFERLVAFFKQASQQGNAVLLIVR
jgi:hypothetical protein